MLLAVVLLALLPATARAGNTYYVSPTGGDVTCSHATPCSVAHFFDNTPTAIGHYADGDTIIVEPGTYDATVHNFLIQHAITLMGDPALARPVVTGSQPQSTEYPIDEYQGQGTHVSHLDIRATNPTGVAIHGNAGLVADDLVLSGGQGCLFTNGGSVTNSSCTVTIGTSATGIAASGFGVTLSHLTVDTSAVSNSTGISAVTTGAAADTISDVTVRAGNTGIQGGAQVTIRRATIVAGNYGVILGQSSLLSDSLVTTTGGVGEAIGVIGEFAEMRNVTAVVRGAGGDGVVAVPNANQAFPYGDVHVRSSIIRASPSGVDVRGQAVGSCPLPPCHTGQVTIDHSDYVTSDGSVTTDASNTSADPLFVDPLGSDFHLRDASPAIDTGLVDASSGPTDVTGAARTQGAAPDMGAYERAPAPVLTPTTTPVVTALPTPVVTAVPMPIPDRKAPSLTALKLSRKTLKSKATLTFTLSEPAMVTITFGRKSAGRKHGKSCVKPTAKLKTAKSCTRLVTKATLTKALPKGAAKLSLTKRVGTKTLSKGAYTLTATAVDAAKNKGKATTVSLTVK